jgi:hypothetical protein
MENGVKNGLCEHLVSDIVGVRSLIPWAYCRPDYAESRCGNLA